MGKAGFISLIVLAISAATCSGGSGPSDGGSTDGGLDGGAAGRPVVTISADPASADVGTQVTFTATITGGTPPYGVCTWRFEAGGPEVAGSISSNTCTGQNTYTSGGLKVITVTVIDGANRTGVSSSGGGVFLSFNVGAEGGTGQPDLIITPGSVTLLSPPAQNRYAPGSTIGFSFTARNVGGGSAAASTAQAKMKNLSTSEEVSLGQIQVGALGPGEQSTVTGSASIPAMQAEGVYDLIVTIDALNSVAEDNETNNSSTLVGGFAVGLEADGG